MTDMLLHAVGLDDIRSYYVTAGRKRCNPAITEEVAASEVTFGLQVSDDGLDGGAAAQLALDDTEDATLVAGDEDAAPSRDDVLFGAALLPR